MKKNHKKSKKNSPKQPQSVVFGIHPIIELIKAKKRKILEIYTTQPSPKAFKQIQAILPPAIIITYVKKDELASIADTTDHQGVVAITTALPLRKKCFDPRKQPFIVLLDGIQDTRNLGGILRTAHCIGADGVVVPEKNAAPLTGATFKASAGLAEHLEIWHAPTALKAAMLLREAGYTLYMAALGGENAIKTEYKTPICVVIGNEATGISGEILKLGRKVMLPQRTDDISYNASVAAGILLFLVATKTKKI